MIGLARIVLFALAVFAVLTIIRDVEKAAERHYATSCVEDDDYTEYGFTIHQFKTGARSCPRIYHDVL